MQTELQFIEPQQQGTTSSSSNRSPVRSSSRASCPRATTFKQARQQRDSIIADIDRAIANAPAVLALGIDGEDELMRYVRAARNQNWSDLNRLAKEYAGLDPVHEPLTRYTESDRLVACRAAIHSGIHARFAQFVEVDVPDGGVYRLLNAKPQLRAFRAKILSQFQSLTRKRTGTGRGLAPLASEVSSADVLAAAQTFADTDGRCCNGALKHVIQDGVYTVGASRSRMIALRGGCADPIDAVRGFPSWRRLLPSALTLESTGLARLEGAVVQADVSSEWLYRELARARAVFALDAEARVELCWDGEKFQIRAAAKDGAVRYGQGDETGTDNAVRMQWAALFDSARVARQLGWETVTLAFCRTTSGDGCTISVVVVFGSQGFALLMPFA